MSVFIGNFGKGLYVKDVDRDEAKVEFTTSEDEAKKYADGWWASTELDWLKFYCNEQESELSEMTVISV